MIRKKNFRFFTLFLLIMLLVSLLSISAYASCAFVDQPAKINYNILSDWGRGSLINVEVENISSNPIENWYASFNFSGDQKILKMWNATYKQKKDYVFITCKKWNRIINPGQKINIGFALSYPGLNEIPSNFKIKTCSYYSTPDGVPKHLLGTVNVETSIKINDKDPGDMIGLEGKNVDVVLSITNYKNKDIVINHTSSMKADYKLLDEDKNILYTWSSNKLFLAVMSDTIIKFNETVEFLCKDILDQKIVDKAKYVKATIAGTSKDFTIENDGYLKKIK